MRLKTVVDIGKKNTNWKNHVVENGFPRKKCCFTSISRSTQTNKFKSECVRRTYLHIYLNKQKRIAIDESSWNTCRWVLRSARERENARARIRSVDTASTRVGCWDGFVRARARVSKYKTSCDRCLRRRDAAKPVTRRAGRGQRGQGAR